MSPSTPNATMVVNETIALEHGLTKVEYEKIKQLLGREPNITELGIFSVMWSEHCSYKSSKVHLRRLPTRGPAVLQGPGENAGIVDIGDDYAAAFKIESHNHPSFVEPFQGAATGVGGILRDIFTMGARPIAAMNSLRFGPISHTMIQGSANDDQSEPMRIAARNARIMEGVVAGIASYGNCFGVPTVGGEVYFEECYSNNPLVNAFALGLFKKDQIFYARASGVGNPVIYVGAKTGRDGIHGASLLASSEFDETSASKRPNVQIGDPFLEKCLLEACLEAMKSGAVVGIQDMGAAGLTCSTCEMGARAGTGIEIDLKFVPQREASMTPYEIMLSESQERMLLVAEKSREAEVAAIFKKWGLDAVTIGHVIDEEVLRVKDHGEVVAEIPNRALTDEAPVYERPLRAPPPRHDGGKGAPKISKRPSTTSLGREFLDSAFKALLASPNLCSRRWVFQQYDHMVRTNTCVLPGADAAVIRIKGTSRALAMCLDGNGRYCALSPRAGARLAVAEACRNLTCVGARPLAATNCLNFGNPEKPEVMWQFSEVIDGLAEACQFFETPITGGNVSFYNETFGKGIYPTPVIGMVGVLDDLKFLTTPSLKNAGDEILLLAPSNKSRGDASSGFYERASEFLKVICGEVGTTPPPLNLDDEKSIQSTCHAAIHAGLVQAAHDVSEGGLAVALAEMGFASEPRLGMSIDLPQDGEAEEILFDESPSRIVVCARPSDVNAIQALAKEFSIHCLVLGCVRAMPRLELAIRGAKVIDQDLSDLFTLWDTALEKMLHAVRSVATPA